MLFKTCRTCSQQIPVDANFCPYCTQPTSPRLWIWLRPHLPQVIPGAIFVFVLLIAWSRSQSAAPASTEAPAPTEPPAMEAPTELPSVADIFTPQVETTATSVIRPIMSSAPVEVITRISWGDDMIQVYVPAGEFFMGSNSGEDNEKPMHMVYLDEYWIDQTEVTNAQYASCVEDGACEEPLDLNSKVSAAYRDEKFQNHPVVFVDWNQARNYCKWAKRRLPTEAEWEKAARWIDGRIYPWGDDPDGTKANFCDVNCWAEDWKDHENDDGYATTSSVGSYFDGASPYGAFDMAGNVYEWVEDWFSPYRGEYQENPEGLLSGSERVLRGGSWGDDIQHIRTVVRSHESPDLTRDFIGFRCAE